MRWQVSLSISTILKRLWTNFSPMKCVCTLLHTHTHTHKHRHTHTHTHTHIHTHEEKKAEKENRKRKKSRPKWTNSKTTNKNKANKGSCEYFKKVESYCDALSYTLHHTSFHDILMKQREDNNQPLTVKRRAGRKTAAS